MSIKDCVDCVVERTTLVVLRRMEASLLACPRCGLPDPRLWWESGSWNISCDPRCGAKVSAARKSEAIAEWNGEPVNPAYDA